MEEERQLFKALNWEQRPWQQKTAGKLSEKVQNRKAGGLVQQQQQKTYGVESCQVYGMLNLKTEMAGH